MTLIPKCFVMCSLLVDLQSHEYPIYPIMLRISMNSPRGCDKRFLRISQINLQHYMAITQHSFVV